MLPWTWGWEISVWYLFLSTLATPCCFTTVLPSWCPEQGFSTLAASDSQEEFVQAQMASLQTKLEKQLLWRNKIAFRFVFTILHGLASCFLETRISLLLLPSWSMPWGISGASARCLIFPSLPLLRVYFRHYTNASWIFFFPRNFRSFRLFYWTLTLGSGNIFSNSGEKNTHGSGSL